MRRSKNPVAEHHRSLWEQVKEQLHTKDRAAANQAIDALVACGDAQVFDALLKSTKSPTQLGGQLRGVGGEDLKAHVFQRLVGEGPESSEHVQRLRSAHADRAHDLRRRDAPHDPRGIGNLRPNSVELHLAPDTPPEWISHLQGSPSALIYFWPWSSLDPLETVHSLEKLRLHATGDLDIAALEGHPNLRRLELSPSPTDLSPLRELSLERLVLKGPADAAQLPRSLRHLSVKTASPIDALPKQLRTLIIDDGSGLDLPELLWLQTERLGPMNCPALESVLVDGPEPNLAALPTHVRKLQTCAGYQGDFHDLGPVDLDYLDAHWHRGGPITGLRNAQRLGRLRLSVERDFDCTQLLPFPIEVLVLDGPHLPDLTVLAGHPTLQRIENHNAYKRDIEQSPVPLTRPSKHDGIPYQWQFE